MNASRLLAVVALAAPVLVLAAGCGAPSAPGGGFRPIDPGAALFWDRQTTENRELLDRIIAEFNAGGPAVPVKADYVGGYSDIFRKVSASIQARTLPAMAVAYQSMTAVYARSGAIVPLDEFIHDPETGLTREELDDFYPVVLETNVYPSLGGKMYSFPFCKSVLMMYFNKRVLAEAGIDAPPKTWDEFVDQCRRVKAQTGKHGYAVSVDASTIAGMIYSMGGEMYADGVTLFDSEASLKAFRIFETLAKERLAYQIEPNSYDDRVALAGDKVAFMFRSSSHRSYTAQLLPLEAWGMAAIPQGDPANPRTVLYGPNINIFNTTPDQQRTAWAFVKHFTSPEVTVRWALGTGYLPIRKSAAADPALQAFWDEWPYNKAPFDCLPFARSEPNVAGWQEVRDLVEDAQTAVLAGLKTADAATAELKRAADAVVRER